MDAGNAAGGSGQLAPEVGNRPRTRCPLSGPSQIHPERLGGFCRTQFVIAHNSTSARHAPSVDSGPDGRNSMIDLRLNHAPRADDPEEPDVPVPPGPEPQEPGENKALTTPINELESRLLRQRKVLVFGAIDDKVARDVTG